MKKAIALGTFDGIHAGHKEVLNKVLPHNSTAVTFRVPPKAVFDPECKLIMTPADKYNALLSLGIKQVDMLDFKDVQHLSATDFLDELVKCYKPDIISCGFNYRFGFKAMGDIAFLESYCKEKNITLLCCNSVNHNSETLSSTVIRNMLLEGKLEEANNLIHGGFGFTAPVLHGDERGRTIGFPTVNQDYPEELVPLKFGVYTSKIIIDGVTYTGITNIGMRPTYRTKKVTSETFIKDFHKEIYGKEITLKPQKFIRPEQKFAGLEQLKDAILKDISNI